MAVQKIIPTLSEEREKEAIQKAQAQLLSYGFTSIMDAGSIEHHHICSMLCTKRRNEIRLYSLSEVTGAEHRRSGTELYRKQSPQKELYDYRLSINAVKFSPTAL